MHDEVKFIFDKWANDLPILEKINLSKQILLISSTLIELTPQEERIVKEAKRFLLDEE